MRHITEDERLAALQGLGILDTDPEDEYDAITDLVTAITGARMAAVSLVDRDRQWFKSAVNLPARETPRDVAFCHHAIRQDGIYEVPNALDDPLFAENPLVTGAPHIRGYAGVPLSLPNGEKVGTLCAIHDAPLALDDTARRRLRALARSVETLMYERASSREHERVAMVAKHTHSAVIITNRSGLITWVNPAFERLSGYAFEEAAGRKPGDLLQCERSEPAAIATMALAVREGEACEVDILNRSKGGTEYTIHIEMTPIHDVNGVCTGFMAVETDITERLATQERLRTSLRETQSLMGVIRDHAIFSQTDADGTILDVNDAFCEISGFSAEDLIGQSHTLIQSGEHSPEFWDDFWAQISGGQAWRGEICNRNQSGELYWVDSIVAPLLDDQGGIERYISIRFDITERKRAEAELRESQKSRKQFYDRLAAVTELGGIGSWEVDLVAQRLSWDRITKQIHEVEPDFVPDLETAINFYAPEARDAISGAVQEGIASGEPWDLELPLITAADRRIWVRAVGRAVSEDGEVVKLVGSFQNISERRRREEELRVMSTRLEVALEASNIGVWEISPTTQEYSWDQGSRRLFDLVEDDPDPTIEEWLANIHPDDRDDVNTAFNLAFKQKGNAARDFRYRLKNGKYRHVRAFGVYRAPLDAPPILTGVHMDITADFEQSEALEQALERAESANRAKSEFLANMSHEIRTPLNGVLGMTQILRLTELSETQAKQVETIRHSGQVLADLIEDVLDISKIESGMIVLEETAFDLHELIDVVHDMMSVRALEKPLDLHIDVDPTVIRHVVGDEKRIRQVLINIVGNAVKFTEEGRVDLAIRPAEGGLIEFSVCDTGPGIPQDEQDIIFDRFAQADSSITRRFGGSGLGLAICSELVDLMGGEIGVDSTPGHGATFWFRLPLPAAERTASAGQDVSDAELLTAKGAGRKVLIVDDVEANLMVVAALLKHSGFDVTTAANGREALTSMGEKTFDAVLMDIQMPVMSGDEAIRRIRASGEAWASLPIFALTADATRATKELCSEIGATGYFTKPLDLPSVLAALNESMSDGDSQTAQAG